MAGRPLEQLLRAGRTRSALEAARAGAAPLTCRPLPCLPPGPAPTAPRRRSRAPPASSPSPPSSCWASPRCVAPARWPPAACTCPAAAAAGAAGAAVPLLLCPACRAAVQSAATPACPPTHACHRSAPCAAVRHHEPVLVREPVGEAGAHHSGDSCRLLAPPLPNQPCMRGLYSRPPPPLPTLHLPSPPVPARPCAAT